MNKLSVACVPVDISSDVRLCSLQGSPCSVCRPLCEDSRCLLLLAGPPARSRSVEVSRPGSRPSSRPNSASRFDPTEYVKAKREREREVARRLDGMRRSARLQLLGGSHGGSLPGSRPASEPSSSELGTANAAGACPAARICTICRKRQDGERVWQPVVLCGCSPRPSCTLNLLPLQDTPPRSAARCPAGTPAPTAHGRQQGAAGRRHSATRESMAWRCAAQNAFEQRSAPPPGQRGRGQCPGSSVQPRQGGLCSRCGSGCSSMLGSRLAAAAVEVKEEHCQLAGWAAACAPRHREGLLRGQRSGSGCQRLRSTMQMPVPRLQTLTAGCRAFRTSCAQPRPDRQWRCKHEGAPLVAIFL